MKRLTPYTRKALKRPLGRLFPKMGAAMREISGKRVVAVGDFCSYKLLRAGVKPDVVVYDHACLRRPVLARVRRALDGCRYRLLRAENPPGCITGSLVRTIRGALARPKAKVLVDGEEDLAALVALIYAKDGTVVAYGQPKQGIVLVEACEKSRGRAKRIYGKMKNCGD